MIDRRNFIQMFGLAPFAISCSTLRASLFQSTGIASEDTQASQIPISKEDWLETAIADENKKTSRDNHGQIMFGRFLERIYYLAKPLSWSPNKAIQEQNGYPSVTVPAGFVTDLASIPRVFYSILPPDGAYTVPAVVHDYLYWTQTTSKATADNILNFSMQDFKINAPTRLSIYEAVHLAGASAWANNRALKAHGEKRILKQYPTESTIKWEDWKKDPSHFA